MDLSSGAVTAEERGAHLVYVKIDYAEKSGDT
jgi:hypothetical protein